jgi:hypothetical protein
MDEAQLTAALAQYQAALVACEAAEAAVQTKLDALREVAGKSTFKAGEQYYQIRTRAGSHYLCKLDGAPKGRPKKTEEEKQRDKEARDAKRKAEADAVVDAAVTSGVAVADTGNHPRLDPDSGNDPKDWVAGDMKPDAPGINNEVPGKKSSAKMKNG